MCLIDIENGKYMNLNWIEMQAVEGGRARKTFADCVAGAEWDNVIQNSFCQFR